MTTFLLPVEAVLLWCWHMYQNCVTAFMLLHVQAFVLALYREIILPI